MRSSSALAERRLRETTMNRKMIVESRVRKSETSCPDLVGNVSNVTAHIRTNGVGDCIRIHPCLDSILGLK